MSYHRYQYQCQTYGTDYAGQVTDGCFDEKLSVHAQDGAGDKSRDIKVKESSVGHECRTCFYYRLWNDMPIYKGRSAEYTYNCAASEEGLDYRCYVTDLVEQSSEQHKEQECADHAAGKNSQSNSCYHDNCYGQEHFDIDSHDVQIVLVQFFHDNSFLLNKMDKYSENNY